MPKIAQKRQKTLKKRRRKIGTSVKKISTDGVHRVRAFSISVQYQPTSYQPAPLFGKVDIDNLKYLNNLPKIAKPVKGAKLSILGTWDFGILSDLHSKLFGQRYQVSPDLASNVCNI